MSLRMCAVAVLTASLTACSDTTTPTSALRPGQVSRSASSTPIPVATDYAVTDLGTLGGKTSFAQAINAQGHIVGTSRIPSGELHAFLWIDGQMNDLGTLGGPGSQARDVNERDEIVGDADAADGSRHAFEWTAHGGMRDLGGAAGQQYSASGINDRGEIVGWVFLDDSHGHALYWPAGGAMQDLGDFGGPGAAQFGGINSRGEASLGVNLGPCNYSVDYRWRARPALLEPMTNLDSPTQDPCGGASATAINDNGTIVGSAADVGSTSVGTTLQGYPYVWSPLSATPLLLTHGDSEGMAWTINNSGAVAGWITSDALDQTAFVWSARRGLALLPAESFTNTVARGINDRGVIVGWGFIGNLRHALMWTPR